MNSNKVIQLTVKEFIAILGSLFSLVIGGTVWTVNLQNRIERRLDEAMLYREFMLWAEDLSEKNPTIKVPNFSKFHGGSKERKLPKSALALDNGLSHY